MSKTFTPAALIQHQLDMYNAKDIDGWLACYATDAQQYTLHGAIRSHARKLAAREICGEIM